MSFYVRDLSTVEFGILMGGGAVPEPVTPGY